jgi:hypothetical protein
VIYDAGNNGILLDIGFENYGTRTGKSKDNGAG